MLPSTVTVGLTAVLTAPRTWTLPAANAVPLGWPIEVRDYVGGISKSNTLTIQRAGSDLINGGTNFVLDAARQSASFVSNGVSVWSLELGQRERAYREIGNAALGTVDRTVATSAAFTAPRTWTLPAAGAFPAGQPLVVADMAGAVSGSNTLTLQAAGADTINGGTTHVLNGAYARATLFSDGVSRWHVCT